MPPLTSIFLGTTTAPARDFVAALVADLRPQRVLLPCAGRFAAAEAIIGAGYPAERIEASDISLFSSLVGYLAAGRDLDELGIAVPPHLAHFVAGAADPAEHAAGVMLAIKYTQLRPTGYHALNLRRDLVLGLDGHRAHLRTQLTILAERLHGSTYRVADLFAEIAAAAPDPAAFVYVNPPGYPGGYAKMFGPGGPTWAAPAVEEFHPARDRPRLYDALGAAAAAAVVYAIGGAQALPTAPWTPVYAEPRTATRTDYLLANRDVARRYAVASRETGRPRRFPIYDDAPITPESVVSFVEVDRPTALYYRDLFVHRLGSTAASTYYLMLIDGAVTTALGLNDQSFQLGRSGYVSETFGISITSRRYARLGKLFMLCLTSGDFKRFLLAISRSYTLHEPAGIQTTSITRHEEGKTDRSVMKLASREPYGAGSFRIVYRAAFRADTWADCLALWCRRWADKERDAPPEPATAAAAGG